VPDGEPKDGDTIVDLTGRVEPLSLGTEKILDGGRIGGGHRDGMAGFDEPFGESLEIGLGTSQHRPVGSADV